MIDLKIKQKEVKSKFSVIQKANDIKTGIESVLDKTDDDIELFQNQIASTLTAYSSNIKKKIPNKDNIFDKVTRDLQKILPIKPQNGESLLRRITRESIKETSESIKPIFLSNIRKLFFSSDNELNCGTTTLITTNQITLSPKEFDYLDILQTDPQSGLGKIIYENSVPTEKIKMNKIFFEYFDESPYNFISIDDTSLFNMQWDSANQVYVISGLTGTNITNISVDQFITKYYETIEFPKISDILKNSLSLIAPVGGINTTNSNYDINLNKLMRVIDKITASCSPSANESLIQTPVDQFSENEIDLSDFFDFDDVEGIDLDDENLRYEKVLRFVDCNDYKQPVNQNIVEEFSYFGNTKNDITKEYNDAILKLAKDAANNNSTIEFPQFLNNIDLQSLKNLPKALLSSIFSPKLFFPIALLWKILKTSIGEAALLIKDLIKKIYKFVYNLLKEIFNKFLTVFWGKVKPQLTIILKDLTRKILKNSKKRYLLIVRALIDILTSLVPFVGIKSCEDFYDAILSLLNSLRVGARQNIPGLLLQLSKRLPGYSENRAIMNITEYLENNGIQTGDIFGEENNIIQFVSSIIKGHQQEMDQNSFVQVSLDGGTIPVAPLGGAAVIIPGLLKAHGKLT
jgi:hypothetical protein